LNISIRGAVRHSAAATIDEEPKDQIEMPVSTTLTTLTIPRRTAIEDPLIEMARRREVPTVAPGQIAAALRIAAHKGKSKTRMVAILITPTTPTTHTIQRDPKRTANKAPTIETAHRVVLTVVPHQIDGPNRTAATIDVVSRAKGRVRAVTTMVPMLRADPDPTIGAPLRTAATIDVGHRAKARMRAVTTMVPMLRADPDRHRVVPAVAPVAIEAKPPVAGVAEDLEDLARKHGRRRQNAENRQGRERPEKKLIPKLSPKRFGNNRTSFCFLTGPTNPASGELSGGLAGRTLQSGGGGRP
jgi:hypothetical protein